MLKSMLLCCTVGILCSEHETAFARSASHWDGETVQLYSSEQGSASRPRSLQTSRDRPGSVNAASIRHDMAVLHWLLSERHDRHWSRRSQRSRRQLTEASPSGPVPCSDLLDALAQESAAFSDALQDSTGIVPASTVAKIARPSAAYTVLLPPEDQLTAVTSAYREGTITRTTARSTLLLHILPQPLRAADLRALGTGSSVATLSRAGNLTVDLPDSEAVSVAVPEGGRAVVTEADKPACGGPSVLHRVNAMLTSPEFPLPEGVLPVSLQGDGDPDVGFIIGVVLACTAVVCVVAAAAVLGRRRSRAQRAARSTGPVPKITANSDRPKLLRLEARPPARSDTLSRDASAMSQWNPVATLSEFSGDDGDSSASAAVLRLPGTFLTQGASSLAGAAAVSLSATTGDPSSSTQSAQRTLGALFSTIGTTSGSSAQRAAPPAEVTPPAELTPPRPGARMAERRRWLLCQLDAIGSTPLLQRFVLLGPSARRTSDDTIVQFARSTTDDEEFALKFFISREKFEAERAVFSHWILGAMLPRLEGMYDNRDGALQDPRGHALPPCVIMERGESLQEWFRRRQPDLQTALPVIAHIAKRVAGMHRGGYVHRDLKPSNIMWLPRNSQWSLIDFGRAAEIGRPAPLHCTLPYAPPEVVTAWNGGRTHTTATHALDAWALGVVVFEMLTGRPVFDMAVCSADDVREALVGQGRLPWERLSVDDRRRLGPFKGTLLLLLQRDPLMRPSLDLLYHKCNALLS